MLTSLVKRTLAAMPGNTRRNSGRNLRREARTQPALAWLMFLADSVRCTITWSAHQYQMELATTRIFFKKIFISS